jgi:DNA polymerase elongation subunit (family B)
MGEKLINILILDIETAPNLAHTWGLYDQSVALNQIVKPSYTLCWAAKWLGKKKVFFRDHKEKAFVKDIYELLTEADAVVHYNGSKFDIPILNKDFVNQGLPPPAPFKEIDLLKTVRRRFRMPSNKLEYVCNFLEIGNKLKHQGHDLWTAYMAGDKKAMQKMKRYNIHDITLTEQLYMRLLPWIPNHPTDSPTNACPVCGGHHLQRRGTIRRLAGLYARYQCQDCGKWSQGTEKLEKLVITHKGI